MNLPSLSSVQYFTPDKHSEALEFFWVFRYNLEFFGIILSFFSQKYTIQLILWEILISEQLVIISERISDQRTLWVYILGYWMFYGKLCLKRLSFYLKI